MYSYPLRLFIGATTMVAVNYWHELQQHFFHSRQQIQNSESSARSVQNHHGAGLRLPDSSYLSIMISLLQHRLFKSLIHDPVLRVTQPNSFLRLIDHSIRHYYTISFLVLSNNMAPTIEKIATGTLDNMQLAQSSPLLSVESMKIFSQYD
jgi:hypothetical protein